MDKQTKKLHLAYMLRCLEELQDGRHEPQRAYLEGVIAHHRESLSRCLPAATLVSYGSLHRAYQRLRWHPADEFPAQRLGEPR